MNATIPIAPVELHTTKLPPTGKEYFCFHIHGRSSHAAQCVKSLVINKVFDYILSIDTFEQHCVLIKCMLQSSRLEDHMKTIGIDQSLCNRSSLEQTNSNNIKKIYQHAGKCYNQQNLKDILDADMVSTSEEFTYESTNVPMTSTPVKKPSAKKSLWIFINIFDVKKKISKHRVGAAKSKLRAIKLGNSLCTNKKN